MGVIITLYDEGLIRATESPPPQYYYLLARASFCTILISIFLKDTPMIWTDPNTWIALTTLTLLEIVLGIDNIIFIAILVTKLPEQQRNMARTFGLS